MPLYEYELCEGECAICKGHFALNRPISAPPLEKCPLCKKSVRKLFSAFHTPQLSKPLSTVDARKAGFSVWKKTSAGEYERQ